MSTKRSLQSNVNDGPPMKQQKLSEQFSHSDESDDSNDSFDYTLVSYNEIQYIKATRHRNNSKKTLQTPVFYAMNPIKRYLLKRNDILFPTNDKMCLFIGTIIDYLASEIIEVSGHSCTECGEILITPTHMYDGVYADDELMKAFKPTLVQFMYETTTVMCQKFYDWIDKSHQNKINYKQFFDGIQEIGLDWDEELQTKPIFAEIAVKKQFITIQDWKRFFNPNTNDVTLADDVMDRCALLFDILNTSSAKNDLLEEWEYESSPFHDHDEGEYERFGSNCKKFLKKEINHRMDVIYGKIYKYVQSEIVSNIYSHEKKIFTAEKNHKYILREEGLYTIIFGYLLYEDVMCGVYNIDGILHDIAVKVLNEKYGFFVYCKLFTNLILVVLPQIHPQLEIRKDAMIVLNALLMNTLDKIIEQLNAKYAQMNKNTSINQLCMNDLKDVLGKCSVSDELYIHAVAESTKAMKKMTLQKMTHVSISDEESERIVKALFVKL